MPPRLAKRSLELPLPNGACTDISTGQGSQWHTLTTLNNLDSATPSQKRQFATDAEEPPNVIELKSGAGTGSRVGWAGYPNAINDTLGMPHLCYFEGVVSAMVDADNEKQIYVIVGHVTRGVSGGPMWHWDDIKKRWEICGIASQYQPFTDGMPGFCIFEPINPVIGFLLQDPRWQIDELKDTVVTGLQA